MDFINDVNLVSSCRGGILHVIYQVANFLNPIVGSAIYLLDINAISFSYFSAKGTKTTGVNDRAFFTIENTGKNPRGCRFAHATSTRK